MTPKLVHYGDVGNGNTIAIPFTINCPHCKTVQDSNTINCECCGALFNHSVGVAYQKKPTFKDQEHSHE